MEGKIDVDRLIDLIVMLSKLESANKRIDELDAKLGESPSTKLDEPFSVEAEEKRQEERGKKPKKKKANPIARDA